MADVNSKCALSNDPMIFEAVSLYQITGDGSYLPKAKAIYSWVRANLVNTTTGQINECINFPKGPGGGTALGRSDNAYNGGSFIEAADSLYRVTGDAQYYDDAQRTADHFLSTAPIVANGGRAGTSYQYWLFKGISDFCTDADLCAKYGAYLRSNAAQAWSERNSAGLTWNNWNKPTNDPNPDGFEMNGMVGLLQVLPVTAASPFSGQYGIKNAASGKLLTISNDSTANAAPVVQGTGTGDASAAWTFVPESNGYYEIKNTHTGQLLNVKGDSGAAGGKAVQWPAQRLSQGNDQWLPVHNADGTWSFYSRNSQLALGDPAGSTATGTQLQQWPQNNAADQEFTLVSQ